MKIDALYERSGNTTTLYRGDSTDIKKFSMGKSDPTAMVGRGIYLTTSFDVAKDYTVKGQEGIRYKSEQGEADDPRGFVYRLFREQFSKKVYPLKEAYYTAIVREISRFEGIFQHEMDTIIGTGREARQHPRYNELMNWKSGATRFAEAYAWVAGTNVLMKKVKELYQREYKAFKATFDNTRMMKSVLGEIIVIPEESIGHVTRFRIPNSYLDKMYRVDEPIEPWLIKWIIKFIGRYIKGFDPQETKVDMRYNHPVEGEQRANSFLDWLQKFETHGARYAWGDHNVGGKGQPPSLMELVYGTHLGQTFAYQDNNVFWEDLRDVLQERGYTGLHYRGGNRTGTNVWAGGSPIKHDAYVLWDQRAIEGFRVSNKPVGINSTDNKLFSRFKFDYVVKDIQSSIEYRQKLVNEMRPKVANSDQIEIAIREWVNSGDLEKQLETSGAATQTL